MSTMTDGNLKDIMGDIGNSIAESMIKYTNPIYIDIDCLLDIRLTALLCLMTESDYEIIKDRIDLYNVRRTKSTCEVFKGISITDNDIDNYLKDIIDIKKFIAVMQSKAYMSELVMDLKSITNRNYLSGNKKPLDIYIGCNNHNIPEIIIIKIVNYIKKHVQNCDIVATTNGLIDYDDQLINKFKFMVIDDFETVINNPKFYQFITDGTFLGVSLCASPYVTKQDHPGDKRLLINSTEYFLNGLFDFKYISLRVRNER